MPTVDPSRYGVSFSIKQTRGFGLDAHATLDWLIAQGFKRFRLMSYWNEYERSPGVYDFASLDWQLKAIAKAGGVVTLCLGARQPRWPENHWPDWAWRADELTRESALLKFIETVVRRYKDNPCIVSYQLENEALLQNFGERSEVDRPRLRQEYRLVRRLDPSRPVIMTTSTSWGIPLRRPIPQQVGFSFYYTLFQNGRYKQSLMYPWVHQLRKHLIYLLHNAPVFVHELQLEPWGPTAIWKMDVAEQNRSMDAAAITRNLRLANCIKAAPIDLWGGEWWYWRHLQGDDGPWQAVRAAIQ